jgi:hypothetical protein
VIVLRRREALNPGALVLLDFDGTMTRRHTYLVHLLGFLARHAERLLRAAPLPLAVLRYVIGGPDNTWLKITFLRAILEGTPRSLLESWTEAALARLRGQADGRQPVMPSEARRDPPRDA